MPGKSRQGKRKTKNVKRLQSQDVTMVSNDKTILSRKVSLASSSGLPVSKLVKELACNFEKNKKNLKEREKRGC